MENVNTTTAYVGTAVPAGSSLKAFGGFQDLGNAAATCQAVGAKAASAKAAYTAMPMAPMTGTFAIPSRPWHAAPPRDLTRL